MHSVPCRGTSTLEVPLQGTNHSLIVSPGVARGYGDAAHSGAVLFNPTPSTLLLDQISVDGLLWLTSMVDEYGRRLTLPHPHTILVVAHSTLLPQPYSSTRFG